MPDSFGSKVPPETGGEGPGGIGYQVPPIAGCVIEQEGACDFRDETPDHQVECDFPDAGRMIVGSPLQFALPPEHEGQGGRDQQHIIKMVMEKPDIQMGFQPPTIEGIETDRQQTQRIATVGERPHSSARITKPDKAASPSLPRKISMAATVAHSLPGARPEHSLGLRIF